MKVLHWTGNDILLLNLMPCNAHLATPFKHPIFSLSCTNHDRRQASLIGSLINCIMQYNTKISAITLELLCYTFHHISCFTAVNSQFLLPHSLSIKYFIYRDNFLLFVFLDVFFCCLEQMPVF